MQHIESRSVRSFLPVVVYFALSIVAIVVIAASPTTPTWVFLALLAVQLVILGTWFAWWIRQP